MNEKKLTFINLRRKMTKYTFEVQSTGMESSEELPDNYTCRNLIYKQTRCKYYKCAFWLNLVDDGDNVMRGCRLMPSSRLHMINESDKLYQRENRLTHKNVKKINYFTRLDVVKKLFDAFTNRSIAYAFPNCIGLQSFSSDTKLECPISPYFETFRTHVDDLTENGSTALYKALKDAADHLIEWRKGDMAKRGNAKLRVVCLSDGKNTEYQTKTEIEQLFLGNNIILDCIVIGDDYDSFLGFLSKKTNGYVFNPSSIRHALNIMELETMISSKNRDKYITRTGVIDEESLPPIKKPTQLQNKKSIVPAEAVLSPGDTNKIIKKQLMEILKNPHPDIDVYINDNDYYFWKVVMKGPDTTPYKNGTWLLYVQFGTMYPAAPPNIRFVTPIKHCNVNNYGRICHSILDRSYHPRVTMTVILNCIMSLLIHPETSDPLDSGLSALYYEADGQYEAEIMTYVNKHALKTREQWRKELI